MVMMPVLLDVLEAYVAAVLADPSRQRPAPRRQAGRSPRSLRSARSPRPTERARGDGTGSRPSAQCGLRVVKGGMYTVGTSRPEQDMV